MVIAALLICAFLVLAFISLEEAANSDFAAYWAGAKLLSQNQNPYDLSALGPLQKAAGRTFGPMEVRNPPHMFLLTLPLGWLSFPSAAILWLLMLVGCLVYSVRRLRQSGDRTHLFAYLFAPVLMCLMAKQCGMFLLLGFTLFLCFHNREKSQFVAGLGLALLSIKPHLFFVLAVPLFFWLITRKKYGILLACLGTFAISSLWRVTLWGDYFDYLQKTTIGEEYIPTLAGTLRLVTNTRFMQVVPLCLALVWVVWYWRRHAANWSWTEQGSTVLLVSVLVAPYSWTTDEVVLLPAILGALYRCTERSVRIFALLNGIAMLESLFAVPMSSGAYFWTTTAWLLWHTFSTRSLPAASAAPGREQPA